jgi:hypothetical protein
MPATSLPCRARVGLLCVALVVGLLVLPAAASARDASFAAAFSANTHLGEGGSFSTELTFTGTEYHGQVAPLAGLTLRLPEGIGLNSAGFPTCNKAEIEAFGLVKCPPGSTAGENGSLRAIVYVPEPMAEEAEVRTVFGPGGVLYFVVQGHTPVLLEDVIEGRFVSDIPPYGKQLVLEEIPTMKQSPSSPDVSITELALNLGTTREVGGSQVSSLTLPSTCPGSFTWDADLTFLGEPSEALETFTTACPPAGTTNHEEKSANSGTPADDGGIGAVTNPVLSGATISSAQIKASLASQLAAFGKAVKIGSLLKHGGLSLNVTALEAGSLSVHWSYAPTGARAAKGKPVLVATGKLSFAAAGTDKLPLRLTAAGRRLLRQSKRVSLRAKGVFLAGSGTVTSVTSGLVARR